MTTPLVLALIWIATVASASERQYKRLPHHGHGTCLEQSSSYADALCKGIDSTHSALEVQYEASNGDASYDIPAGHQYMGSGNWKKLFVEGNVCYGTLSYTCASPEEFNIYMRSRQAIKESATLNRGSPSIEK